MQISSVQFSGIYTIKSQGNISAFKPDLYGWADYRTQLETQLSKTIGGSVDPINNPHVVTIGGQLQSLYFTNDAGGNDLTEAQKLKTKYFKAAKNVDGGKRGDIMAFQKTLNDYRKALGAYAAKHGIQTAVADIQLDAQNNPTVKSITLQA